jgi:hypothetical protein
VTPSFIRRANERGFKNLSPDELIKLRQSGVIRDPG